MGEGADAEPDNLSLIPGIHPVQAESLSPHGALWSLHMLLCVSLHIHAQHTK